MDEEDADITANVSRCCISAIGMLANLLILFIVTRYPAMRTACNVYVANLAATDFALCLLALIQSIVGISEPPSAPQEGSSGLSLSYMRSCDIGRIFVVFLGSASVFLLTVIAVERYRAITNPLSSRQHGTVKHSRRISALVWMVAVLAAVMDTIARNVVTEDWTFTGASLYTGASCVMLKIESSDASHPFFVMLLLSFLFLYVLPSCIIIPLYILILIQVRRSRRLAVIETRSGDQAFLVVFVVTIFFLVTMLPFYIMSFLIHSFDPNKNYNITGVSIALSFLVFNSVANPFLYALLGRNFRNQLKRMLCCKQDTMTTIQTISATSLSAGSVGQTQATDLDETGEYQATGGTGQTMVTVETGQTQPTGQNLATNGTGQIQATVETGQTQATVETGQTQATVETGQTQATV
ncbi:somatostatin receptor type 1-like [Branchiostoma floridae]|uniref:Somatostatin receptor type 1-like n=1 Tax=Branchiostoma floridae TaxID=7739 RepID=A0A9J7LVG9_BRAFL|nr:somatostatin receptor type 1-like [Branchiostoma floridae]